MMIMVMVTGIKTFVIDKVLEAGGKVCPPTIVGVGVGGVVAGHQRIAVRPGAQDHRRPAELDDETVDGTGGWHHM